MIGAAGVVLSDGLVFRAFGAPQLPKPTGKGKAKSVIQLWGWGGPSHLDTFDPKPGAGSDYCGPLDHPIPTNVNGWSSAN